MIGTDWLNAQLLATKTRQQIELLTHKREAWDSNDYLTEEGKKRFDALRSLVALSDARLITEELALEASPVFMDAVMSSNLAYQQLGAQGLSALHELYPNNMLLRMRLLLVAPRAIGVEGVLEPIRRKFLNLFEGKGQPRL